MATKNTWQEPGWVEIITLDGRIIPMQDLDHPDTSGFIIQGIGGAAFAIDQYGNIISLK